MATFLVFEPKDCARTQEAAERVVFVREKFSWPAFIFTPFWLLRWKLWFGFLLWLVAFLSVTVLGARLGYGPWGAVAASIFPSLYFALDAANLRTRKLLRSGYREAAIIDAKNVDAAERHFFVSWQSSTTAEPSVPPLKTDYPYPPQSAPVVQPQIKTASTESGVIGLFPNPGAR